MRTGAVLARGEAAGAGRGRGVGGPSHPAALVAVVKDQVVGNLLLGCNIAMVRRGGDAGRVRVGHPKK